MAESGTGVRAANVRLADAIEALSEGFALFDEDGALVLHNQNFSRMNPVLAPLLAPGVAFDLLVREASVRGAIDAAAAQRLLAIENRLDPGEPAETIEIEGSNERVSAVTLSATRQHGFVVTQRDVTARRRLQESDREAEQLLRQVLEACPANVVMSRVVDGQVIYRSPAASEVLGTGRDSYRHFASREQRADFVTALLPVGQVENMPITCLRPDGTTFPASISARLIDYRGEDVIVSSIVDLTRETAMQAELAAQRETIFQNEKMSALGELLAGVAHELNNPLSVVVGHSMMLREETSDPEVLRRIDKIGQAAERCSRIVKSFLAMARQEPTSLAPVDFNAAVSMGLDAACNGPAGLGASVETALAGALPPVLADADQIAQLVVNLVANADQAMAESGTGDRIWITTRVGPGGKVELEVADNGPGIPEQLRGRVFEPFFTTKDVGEGTGIGLALCHRIVTSHGGEIRAGERDGGGAAFTVRLPATATQVKAQEQAHEVPAPSSRAHVLVVEDEDDVAELICEILAREGFVVDHALSGEAALECLSQRHYDLVLSDLAMPGMGGQDLYEAIGRDHAGLKQRVSFVTGDTMGPAARSFLARSGRPYLEKPIVPSELRELVRKMMAGKA